MEGGYRIDVVFTSRLKRAIRSVWILLQELNAVYMPVFKSWRLNERKLRRFGNTLFIPNARVILLVSNGFLVCNAVLLPGMYGALTGLSKQETAEQLGQELVQEWRGSLRSRPPPVTVRHPYWPGRERKYADLSMDQIPMTESLIDCMERTFPLWERRIMVELKKGRNVMVVAHANTLRGLVKTIDSIGDDEIQGR